MTQPKDTQNEAKHIVVWIQSSEPEDYPWTQIACLCGARWHAEGEESNEKVTALLDAHIASKLTPTAQEELRKQGTFDEGVEAAAGLLAKSDLPVMAFRVRQLKNGGK